MPKPFVLAVWPSIQVKDDLVVLDLHIRDQNTITRPDRNALLLQRVQVVLASGIQPAVRNQHQPLAALRHWTHRETLLRMHIPDQFLPRLSRQPVALQVHVRRFHLGIASPC